MIAFTVPPIASEPQSTDPGPITTSSRSIESGSTVFQYWFGPSRKTELLSRTPSIRKRFLNAVNPRRKGDPCPYAVSWTMTPGRSRSACGVVR